MSKLDRELRLLFHSYSPTNETLAIEQATKAIKELMLELVGRDEEHPSRIGNPSRSNCAFYDHMEEQDCDCGLINRNLLRAELREKVKAL